MVTPFTRNIEIPWRKAFPVKPEPPHELNGISSAFAGGASRTLKESGDIKRTFECEVTRKPCK